MAASMYRVGDCVYFECSSTMPYQIRKIEELCKTAAGTVEAKVVSFYRRRDLSSSLIAAADKHHVAVDDGMENGDTNGGRNGDTIPSQNGDSRFHQLKCRELFLSRQVENLSATHIRGKCSVTLLSEAESPLAYLDKDDTFFYSLVYDAQAKTLIADHGDIRVGSRYQVETIPDVIAAGESDGRDMMQLEQLVWNTSLSPPDLQIDQLMMIAKSVGTFSRALDSVNTVRQPSLHMSAAAASRDITLFHAMDVLHQHDYDIVSSLQDLVPPTGPKLCRDQMEEWSASEANLFEEALDKYGKSFRDIWKDYLPWKSMKSIIEYYYMWKTTDRYVQQKRIKAAESERKLKQVYIPSYNKPSPAVLSDRQNGVDGSYHGRPCESCSTLRSPCWYSWGPVHSQCRLCSPCWVYWKKYGGLKKPASKSGSQDNDVNSVENHVKVMRCSLAGCGKEFRVKAHLVRHLTDTHGLVLPTLLGSGSGSADSPLSVLSASGSAVKTRAAFCLVTTVLTRVSRQLCKNVLNVRRSARCPFRPINITAIKQECQLLMPELIKRIRQLRAKKRVSMNQVSARLGINITVDKPELLRPVLPADRKIHAQYAFPVAQPVVAGTVARSGTPVNATTGVVNTRKRGHEHTNGGPPAKVPATMQSIKTTEPKMRGSTVNSLQNGAMSSGKPMNIRGRKHNSVNADSLDDVFFVATDSYRKHRKRNLTTVTMKRSARKPWILMSNAKSVAIAEKTSVVVVD